jgi:hypothetical protein
MEVAAADADRAATGVEKGVPQREGGVRRDGGPRVRGVAQDLHRIEGIPGERLASPVPGGEDGVADHKKGAFVVKTAAEPVQVGAIAENLARRVRQEP